MTFEQIKKIIDEVNAVHGTLRHQVNFNTRDKKHAIYLIQGGILTALTTAYKFNNEGYIVPATQQKRMIDEAVDLILFFDEIPEGSRQIISWFKGNIVARTTGNSGNLSPKERAKIYGFTIAQVQTIDKLRKNLTGIYSKYMHPSLHAVRANASKTTNAFDYECERTRVVKINPADFGNLYVVPAIHALLLPFKTLQLDKLTFTRLNRYAHFLQLQ